MAGLRVIERTRGRDVAVLAQLAPGRGGKVGGPEGRHLQRGQPEGRRIVKVPVLLRRHEGQVGLEEPDSNEPRLAGLCLRGPEATHGLVGDPAVAVGVVRHVGAFRGRAARKLGWIDRRVGESRLLARELGRTVLLERVAAGWAGLGAPVGNAPRGRVLAVAMAHVKDLAHGLGAVAVALEVLGHGDRVGDGLAEVGAEVVDADGLRAQAGHERVARRGAYGLVGERPLKQHAPGRQPVDARRADQRRAVAAQEWLEVVHANQQDVRFLCRLLRGRKRAAEGEHGGQQHGVSHRACSPRTWGWLANRFHSSLLPRVPEVSDRAAPIAPTGPTGP